MFQFQKRYYFAFLHIIAFASIVLGQNPLSTSSILATAKTQTAIALQERKIDALTTTSFRLPFLEKIDFQT